MFKHNFKIILLLILTTLSVALPSITHAQLNSQRLSEIPGITIEIPEDLSPNLSREIPTESVIIGDNKGPIDSLIITAYDIDSIGNTNEESSENQLVVENETITSSVEPLRMVGNLLNFPNPFQLKNGTTIRYQLNQDAAIEIRIYDQFANEILRETYAFGTNGGKGNLLNFTNSIELKRESFNTPNVPAGIYFYTILNEGKVLGKGKMAIVP
jgi:hypothetical protein